MVACSVSVATYIISLTWYAGSECNSKERFDSRTYLKHIIYKHM